MQHPEFSETYAQARTRFLHAAESAGAGVESFPLPLRGPDQEVLAVDVAHLGPAEASRVVVISSGLHGVEGYLGSALQYSLLNEFPARELPADTALLVLHALNPYGFAWTRRFDQDNVDLNRNFLLEGERYAGTPDDYDLIQPVLSPPRPPRRFSAFRLRAALKIARHGFNTLKAAVAGGQYEYPLGLFFGGKKPATTHLLLKEHLPRLLAHAKRVIHLDVHTGLGERADYALLVDCPAGDPRLVELTQAFGPKVEGWDKDGTAYEVRGGLGPWCEQTIPHAQYAFLTAEFGTVPPLSVIEALHLENRGQHYSTPNCPGTIRAKRLVRAAFAPHDPSWRGDSLQRAKGIVDQAFAAIASTKQPARTQ